MSWSLALRNGDFTLGTASLGIVTHEAKMVQDLRAYILESMGTDNMHRGFGSLIQGGVEANGVQNPGVIGKPNDPFARTMVVSEIKRLVRDYQQSQLERARADQQEFGKPTLSTREVLLSLDDIFVDQTNDQMTLTLFITTAANRQVEVSILLT